MAKAFCKLKHVNPVINGGVAKPLLKKGFSPD